ncbi:NUDIX domain-containing protein [Rutstroemia sp. NJR-2017a WRK4]|nr:NUDIX domain-containing protein [Rutstroemia sp. NJR-2017a WRK4]
MSSSATPSAKKPIAVPRPSASILLISPQNQILLLHRVRTSSSFASAHVFPGGNLSATDGTIPPPESDERHLDSEVYRVGAVRECFEESGILLAKSSGGDELLQVPDEEREQGRKDIHAGKIGIREWVDKSGGKLDVDGLHPFTRWVTPSNLPKRFTTQMYIYFLPLTTATSSTSIIPAPTSDGGLEHTAAEFASCASWLSQARRNEIILFPPQFYLMYLLAPFLPSDKEYSESELRKQRDDVMEFLKTDGGDGTGVPWGEKVMSPVGLMMGRDGRSVLGLGKQGPELSGKGKSGDEKRVVLVKFSKEGPRDVEVREKKEVLEEERKAKEESKL